MTNRADPLLVRSAETPDKPAILYEGRRWTWSEVLGEVRRMAGLLAGAGMRDGDKLAIMLSSRPEFIFAQHAAFWLGGTVVPLNMHYRGDEAVHVLAGCEVELLLTEPALLPQLGPELAARCATLRRVLVLDDSDPPSLQGVVPGAVPDAPVPTEADRTVLMLHTSATTGRAKGVMLSRANLESNYDKTPGWLGIDRDTVILGALPLYNTYALNQCINAAIVTGATLVLLPRFKVSACVEAIQTHRCSFFPAVPTMLVKLLHDPEASGHDLSSLKRIGVGAAPVSAALLDQVHARMHRTTTLFTGYGLTEATAIVANHEARLGPDGAVIRPKTVGRPWPGISVTIRDEHNREVAPGTEGEICIQGPNVMKGYYNQEQETASALAGGWLHTGDIGVMEPDGYFAIIDRKKDLIIRGGQNIYPSEIEEVLYFHDAVAEAAVVSEPDELLGEVPVAYVALKPGTAVEPEALVAHCRQSLAYFKVPKAVWVLPELPKGPTGKILRRGLRREQDHQPTQTRG